jgi:hypothetical protein
MRDERSLDEKLAPQDFVGDFIWAARAVFSQPSVALLSIALWCIPVAISFLTDSRTALACLACWFVTFGWYGAERVFFLCKRDGKEVSLGDLLWCAPHFGGRFFRLGLLAAAVALPLRALVFARLGETPSKPARVELLLIVVAGDFLLTFVTSALVFTTRSAWQALRIGVSMIRQTWPRSGLYVLCPPLALNMLNVIYPVHLPVVRLVTTATFVLLALLAKGATVAFYLRERPVVQDVVGTI